MKFEKRQFEGHPRASKALVRFHSKNWTGPFAETKFEALTEWAVHALGIGIKVGDVHDNDGLHQHKVFSVQTRSRRAGEWRPSKLGAIVAFIVRPKGEH